MPYILVGIAALSLGLLALGGFARADVTRIARSLRVAIGGAALASAGVLAVRGALSSALPLAMFGAWLLWSGGAAGTFGGTPTDGGRSSSVKTAFLEMELDHASGAMTGRVIAGAYAGQELETLPPAVIAHLWRQRRFDDPASAQLLASYLDRRHPTWREDMARTEEKSGDWSTEGAADGDGVMTLEEACQLLGVTPDADARAVRRAHRRKMQAAHPDHGGSSTLAARLNAARDLLLSIIERT